MTGKDNDQPPFVEAGPDQDDALDALHAQTQLLVKAYEEHGPIFRIRDRDRISIVLAGPEASDFYLKHQGTHFSSHGAYRTLSAESGAEYNLSALDNEPHRHLRQEMKPGYSREIVAPAVAQMVGYVRKKAQSWKSGQELDATATLSHLLMAQAGISLLNQELAEEDYEAIDVFSRALFGSGATTQPDSPPDSPSYQWAKDRFSTLFNNAFAEHRAQPAGMERRYDLIDVSLHATKESGEGLSDAEAKDSAFYAYAMNSVFTSRLAVYLLHEVLKDPELKDTITAEVDAVFAGGDLTITALNRMSYLRNAITETMRMHPVVTTLPRHASNDFEFAGYQIKAGQKVMIAATVTHFLPEYFPQPHTFDVTRYRSPRNEHLQPGGLAPFGLGDHQCLGANLTELYIMTTIAGLFRTVELTVAEEIGDLKSAVGASMFRLIVGDQRPLTTVKVDSDLLEDEDLVLWLPGLVMEKSRRDQLLRNVVRRTFEPGATIIQQGDEADAFYILTQGDASVYRDKEFGRLQLIGRLTEGDFFGEIGLLQGVNRTATVKVGDDGPAEALVMDRETFAVFVTESDLTAAEIAAMVRRRTVSLNLAKALPNLTSQQINEVSPYFETHRFLPGEVIIRQGDAAESFYIITEGRADVLHENLSGEQFIIDHREEGEFFGEIGLIQERPRTATVRAATGGVVEVLTLDQVSFTALMGDSRATEMTVAQEMIRRLIRIGSAIED